MRKTQHKKRVWVSPDVSEKAVGVLSKELGVNPIIAQILVNRGLQTAGEAAVFLRASINNVHEPASLPDIEKATKRIRSAIDSHEKIAVFGDFDVDGITSTALLFIYLRTHGADVSYYIPSRLNEGYGLNVAAINSISKTGVQLIITCDCGISAHEEILEAKSLGMDVIVTDHHEPGANLPLALAVVNPKRRDSVYPFRELAGVGVAFKLMEAVEGNFDSVADYLDLVALGTVADIVPLIDENRALVKEGLKNINTKMRLGLKSLIEASGLTAGKITSEHLAYIIGPRINVAGRLETANIAFELLTATDKTKANEIASILHEKNKERRTIEQEMFEEALDAFEADAKQNSRNAIILYDQGWHEGVKGIVASRMVERFHKPTIIFSHKNGLLVGSGRSIPGFHLHNALLEHSGLLEGFGGHEHAAGLTCHPDKLDDFRNRFLDFVDSNLTDDLKSPQLKIDCWVEPQDLTRELAESIAALEPFGNANPRPVLGLSCLMPQNLQSLSEGRHIKFGIAGSDGVKAIFFNPPQEKMDLVFKANSSECLIDVALDLQISSWNNNETIDAKLLDIRASSMFQTDGFIESLFANAEEILKREDYKNIGDSDCFYTKIAGVSFEGRQDKIRDLAPGQKLVLTREPENEFDPNAIKVTAPGSIDLGFLNARLAKQLAPLLDEGREYNVIVTDVTGGNDSNFGVNVEIRRHSSAIVDDTSSLLAKKRTGLNGLADDGLWGQLISGLLGFEPRPKQLEAWGALRSGHNCLVVMGTGRGKSAIFQVYAAYKAIRDKKISIITYPLRALASDQMHILKQKLVPMGINVFHLTGDLSVTERDRYLSQLEAGQCDIVLTTPEFLYFHIDKFAKIAGQIGFFVVDEAHHICTSTESHRPLYKKMAEITAKLGSPQTLAATATADSSTADTIIRELAIGQTIVDSTIRDNLNIIDCRGCADKKDYLQRALSRQDKSIIYVNSREQSVELARDLREVFPKMRNEISYYNASLDNESRVIIEDRFRAGSIKTIVATSAFGEGVNIPDVRNIVHYHLNFNKVEFNQQSGRAGRDDLEANIHLIFNEEDARINEMILESTAPTRDSLAELYRAVCSLSRPVEDDNDKRHTKAANAEVAAAIEDLNGFYLLNEAGIESGLKIFEELKLVSIKGNVPHRNILLMPKPEHKLDLSDSVRFQEGVDEKELFREFKKWVFSASLDDLLIAVNRPIFPVNAVL